MLVTCTSESNYLPKAVATLDSIKHISTYHLAHSLRPPLGIYNVSFNNVINAFSELLDQLDIVVASDLFRKPPENRGHVEPAYELGAKVDTFYSKLMNYFDDCLSVLSCFFSADYRTSPYVQEYEKAIKSYRSHVATIYSSVKHKQHHFRILFLFGDGWVNPGFFVETVDQQGFLGPSLEIHPQFKGRETAFSFNRILKYHLWGIYMVSECLSKALLKITQSPDPQSGNIDVDQPIVRKVIERVANRPYMFFNDEQQYSDEPSSKTKESKNMPVPVIDMSLDSDGNHVFKMTYPATKFLISPVLPGQKVNAWVGYVGDGVSASFKLPYFPGKGSNFDFYIEK